MTKTKKSKRNIWKDPSPYGTYSGSRGSKESWAKAFSEASSNSGAMAIVASDSPWAILGLSPGDDIRKAKLQYHKLLLENHPDRGGDVKVCQRIIAAWTLISERLSRT